MTKRDLILLALATQGDQQMPRSSRGKPRQPVCDSIHDRVIVSRAAAVWLGSKRSLEDG
jgi:hypothetical protein